MSDRPEQRPEGRLIAAAQKRHRTSNREAAPRAGISEARWRHIVTGYRSEAGQYIPVRGPAETLARMAQVVGVTPEELEEADREDAAAELRELQEKVEQKNAAEIPPSESGIPSTEDLDRMSPEELIVALRESQRRTDALIEQAVRALSKSITSDDDSNIDNE